MKKISKEKLLVILGVSLILVSLGMLGLTYPSRSKAATTSFSETWTINKYANVQVAVQGGNPPGGKVAYTVPTGSGGLSSVKGVLGPGAWKISGCMNNASGSCSASPDYEITYTVNGWYAEGRWSVASNFDTQALSGSVVASDISLDSAPVNLCATTSKTYIGVSSGPCPITSTTGQYNRHLSSGNASSHSTIIVLDLTAWPTGWGVSGTMTN
ncbi:MAG: hypothetical protein WCV58_02785 [Patescibacteria group bacterium]